MLKQKTLFSLLALFAGAVLPLAFAPFGYYLTAEVSLVLLLLVWSSGISPGQAFWYGWLFGLAFFSCGVYWIYISIHHFGNAPVVLALLILGLLIAFLALFPALQGYLLNRMFPQSDWRKLLLAFPASWVILEWVRGWILSGFPWLFLGYGHVNAPLGGWATVLGVYGVSFFVAQTAGAIACMFFYRNKPRVLAMVVVLVAALWSCGYFLAKVNWTKRVNEPLQVSLIQGNIPLQQKWDEKELSSILNLYAHLTSKNFASNVIVWPEAAIPTYPENVSVYLKLLSLTAKMHNATVLSGIPFYDKETDRFYNGILSVGVNEGRYYKRHLVPFGEYLPLRFMLSWLCNYLTIPMSGFSSGVKNQPDMFIANTPIAPFVCYEIAYAELVLNHLPRAGLLVTVCDDSWFGESIAAAQHLEVAQMRSLEVGRYQLLCTNTGITAIIDDGGKITSRLPVFEQGVLTEEVQMLSGATPWVRYGQYIWLFLFIAVFLAAVLKKVNR